MVSDLLFDSEGSLKFKPEWWSDIRKVIVPTLVDKVSSFYTLFHIKLLTSNIFRSAPFPSPVSSIPTTQLISSRILHYPDAISSQTSYPARHIISSKFHLILLLPTSTTTSSPLSLGRCRSTSGMSHLTSERRPGLRCLILDRLMTTLAGRV